MGDRHSECGRGRGRGRGRAANSSGCRRGVDRHSSHPHSPSLSPDGADSPFGNNENLGSGGGRTRGRWNNTRPMSNDGSLKNFNRSPRPVFEYRVKKPASNSNSKDEISVTVPIQEADDPTGAWSSNQKQSEDVTVVHIYQSGQSQNEITEDNTSLHLDFEEKMNVSTIKDMSESAAEYSHEELPSQVKGPKKIGGIKDSGNSKEVAEIEPFDICPPKPFPVVTLKPSLLVMNREKRNEKRSMAEPNGCILRPGMILLRNYLSISDQLKIVKICRDLGLGPGGFYQPGYRDGGKLHLKMMCLGKNWDPETSKYGDLRPIDGAKPPIIPHLFFQWIKEAIKDSHTLIEKNFKKSNVEDLLPCMIPNICIVNFYSESGRLGLHQDKDESVESLHKRLPVVSFSIGDSAEFLYGDGGDVEKAEKVELKSGDVLIFGGESRLIFHGVNAIFRDTAPKVLLEETKLKPGRLNLTFRQY